MYKTIHILFLLIVFSSKNNFKSQTKPSAKFSFNNKTDCDEISKQKAKLIGTVFTKDRFDNDNNAVYLNGNKSSYINLGNYNALKPNVGTISLWVKIENKIWWGTGPFYNPIIITKSTNLDDFYEAYAIYLMLESEKLVAVNTMDSTVGVTIFNQKKFQRNTWYHLVISYDFNYFSFYVDGQLSLKLPKKFKTAFYEKDSVLIGTTGNKKNNRWLNGTVDDIEFFDKVLTDEEINELFHAPNPNKNKIILNWVLIFLALIILITTSYFFIKHQIKIAVKKERLKFELSNKLLETELRANRASMNPHFLFNSLNTLHSFILINDTDNASDYLVKFSKLIRKILDSNMYDSISLDLEVEILERYLEIENLRFDKNINYTIVLDDAIIPSRIQIPLMMLQPFIENSIWYGLLNKSGEKKITITFSLFEDKYIYCVIEDNGTGRKKKSKTSFVEKKSLATVFIKQRLDILNKIYNLNCSLIIEDKPDNQGTIVRIILPILKS
jgi:hypothetical protein